MAVDNSLETDGTGKGIDGYIDVDLELCDVRSERFCSTSSYISICRWNRLCRRPAFLVSRQRAVSVDFTLSTIGKVAVTVGNNADGVRPEAINPEPLNQEISVDIKFTVDRKDGDPVLAVNLPDADVTKTVASYSVFI